MDKSPHFPLQSVRVSQPQATPAAVHSADLQQAEGNDSHVTYPLEKPSLPAGTQSETPESTRPTTSPAVPLQHAAVHPAHESPVGPRVAQIDDSADGATPQSSADAATPQLTVAAPPEHELAAKTVDSLLRVTHRLRSVLGPHFTEFELSEIRFVVLRMIRDAENGCSQRDVADHLMQSESSISTLIERMRRDGLIYRLTSATDRRRKTLMLSERGRALLASAEQPHAQRMHLLLSQLSSEERSTLVELLRRVDTDVTACAAKPPWADLDTQPEAHAA